MKARNNVSILIVMPADNLIGNLQAVLHVRKDTQ